MTVEFKTEATEVASVLQNTENAIGLLPQPFVTVACSQNEALRIALDLTEEWDKVQGEEKSSLVTGVTVVRNEFLEEHPEAVKIFLEEHKSSADFVNQNVDGSYGIPKELWRGHFSGAVLPNSIEQIEQFCVNASCFITARSTRMLIRLRELFQRDVERM